jgi:hypothetical protein
MRDDSGTGYSLISAGGSGSDAGADVWPDNDQPDYLAQRVEFVPEYGSGDFADNVRFRTALPSFPGDVDRCFVQRYPFDSVIPAPNRAPCNDTEPLQASCNWAVQ